MSWVVLNPANTRAELLNPFSEQDVAYCQALSDALLKAPQTRTFPELIALGYWLRAANLIPLLAQYQHEEIIRRPLGLVFHSAPANVDSLFVYSGILSLLCGNANVIRLSSRSGASTAWLIETICSLKDRFPQQNARFQLVQCPYDSDELKKLISAVDGRVLWGSDETIQAQRQLTTPAHARELCFGHKFSLCLLGAERVVTASQETLQQLAQFFYRDNMTFSQQGCSSAKAVLWLGNPATVEHAQQKFWRTFIAIQTEKQPLGASEHYNALSTAQQLILSSKQQLKLTQHLGICRIKVQTLEPTFIQQHQGYGLFLEQQLNELSELTPWLTQANQTLSVWGVCSSLLKQWLSNVHTGIDRVVPVGEALTFSPEWDGVNLIEQFSRRVTFSV